jgi:hypothetical protein
MDENENFESLRRLLALKRHEVPPPGYFHNFSGQVISRIELGEDQRQSSSLPWFLGFVQFFEAKPAFAGAFASALCLLLVFGIVNAERPEITASQPILQQTAENTSTMAPATLTQSSQPSSQPMLALNSTNPVLNFQANVQQPMSVNDLFGQTTPSVQEVDFTPPGQQ